MSRPFTTNTLSIKAATADINDVSSVIANSTETKATSLDATKRLTIGSEILEEEDITALRKIVTGNPLTVTSMTDSYASNGITMAFGCRTVYPFFPTGEIVNIRVTHNKNHTTAFPDEPVWLYLNVDGTVYRSINPIVYDGPVGYSDFKFDHVIIPSTYTRVDVLMSHKDDLEPAYDNRTDCIKFSSMYSTHSDLSSCRVRLSGGEGAGALLFKVTTVSEEAADLSSYITKEQGDSYYLPQTDVNEDILNTLGTSVPDEDGLAVGWFYLGTPTQNWYFYIEGYERIQMLGEDPKASDWCDLINSSGIPYYAEHAEEDEYTVYITARYPGSKYCLPFGLIYDPSDSGSLERDEDDISYSGETLAIESWVRVYEKTPYLSKVTSDIQEQLDAITEKSYITKEQGDSYYLPAENLTPDYYNVSLGSDIAIYSRIYRFISESLGCVKP